MRASRSRARKAPFSAGSTLRSANKNNARNRGRTVTGVWFECSWGGAGMKVRVPSNGSITPTARKGSARIFQFPIRPGVLAERGASTQIPFAGKRSTPARTMSFHRGLGRVRAGPHAAQTRAVCRDRLTQ